MPLWDDLWIDVRLATMRPDLPGFGALEGAALAVDNGRIAWVGPVGDLPGDPHGLARRLHRAQGRWMTPGLIDCHTHVVFGGERWREFELRLKGASYEEIARAGGGILATVAATRAAGEDQLFAAARRRLAVAMSEGVTTVEVKSGYGLDLASELKMLRVARRLGTALPLSVRTTFLGAHALPPDYADRRAAYVDFLCAEALPAVAQSGLADAVDGFCESIAFEPDEIARIFSRAQALALPVKLHADQLSDRGGAALAARFGALSADHLEHAGEDGVRAMAAAGTVAVLLPGASYFLREERRPPVATLRAHGVPIAIASNCNPGSSPALSLLLMLSMAATLFRLTPEEALAGVTRNAARALGLDDRGVLAPGLRADLVLWDIEHPAELAYWIGGNPAAEIVQAGHRRCVGTGNA